MRKLPEAERGAQQFIPPRTLRDTAAQRLVNSNVGQLGQPSSHTGHESDNALPGWMGGPGADPTQQA